MQPHTFGHRGWEWSEKRNPIAHGLSTSKTLILNPKANNKTGAGHWSDLAITTLFKLYNIKSFVNIGVNQIRATFRFLHQITDFVTIMCVINLYDLPHKQGWQACPPIRLNNDINSIGTMNQTAKEPIKLYWKIFLRYTWYMID